MISEASSSDNEIELQKEEQSKMKDLKKILSLDPDKIEELSNQEKKLLFKKIESLLDAMKTGKDTKELFSLWTQGKVDLFVNLQRSGNGNSDEALLLQISSLADKNSGKDFQLKIIGFENDTNTSKLQNLLKQFMHAGKSEKSEVIAVVKDKLSAFTSGNNARNANGQLKLQNAMQQMTVEEKFDVIVLDQKSSNGQNQQTFGKRISALLASLNGNLSHVKSEQSTHSNTVEQFSDFKKQLLNESNKKKVKSKSQDVQLQLNDKAQKPQVGVVMKDSTGAEKNFIGALQNTLGESSTIRGFGSSQNINARSVLAQVVQKIESMVQTAKIQQNSMQSNVLNANLALRPQSLGSVMMNLRFHQDSLSGLITTATKEAKSLIEANLPAIKEALQQQNTVVQNIEVEVRPDLEQEHEGAFAQEFSQQKENEETEESKADHIFGMHLNKENKENPEIKIIDPVQSSVNLTGEHAFYA